MKIRTFCIFCGIAAAFVYLILFPQQASAAMAEGLALCGRTIIPAMFPYFVLSGLFISLGCADTMAKKLEKIMPKLFHVSGTGASPLLLGLIGGYPMGAKVIADMRKTEQLTKAEAQKLLFFCCNAGPAFIIGVVGGALYRSTSIGLALYAIHTFSALLCGLLSSAKSPVLSDSIKANTQVLLSFPEALVSAVSGAVQSILQVCGFILLFSVLTAIETQLLPSSDLFLWVTELSTGASALAAADVSWAIKFALTSAALSFGGLCVACQTMAVLSGTDLGIQSYLFGKIVQAVLSAVIAYPVSYLLEPRLQVSNFPDSIQPLSPFPWNFLPLLLLIIIFLQFPSSFSRRSRL